MAPRESELLLRLSSECSLDLLFKTLLERIIRICVIPFRIFPRLGPVLVVTRWSGFPIYTEDLVKRESDQHTFLLEFLKLVFVVNRF
jgi:hypothetical protein